MTKGSDTEGSGRGSVGKRYPKKTAFDLEERTAVFGENMIDFLKTIACDRINDELVRQAVRSSTSIGANYMEADGAQSKKDFRHKIALCKKEAKETMHWLRMIARASPDQKQECRRHWSEAQELVLIFSAILRSSADSHPGQAGIKNDKCQSSNVK